MGDALFRKRHVVRPGFLRKHAPRDCHGSPRIAGRLCNLVIAVILHRHILGLKVMGGTLVHVANLAACRKVVGRLRFIQGHAKSHIRVVLVVALRKPNSGKARDIGGTIPRRRTANNDIVAIRANRIRNR